VWEPKATQTSKRNPREKTARALHVAEESENEIEIVTFPLLDNRRGLINFGETILKSLFGTVTTADMIPMHRTLDDFQDKYADVTHSLYKQLTYIKKLGTLTEASAEAIANLSSIAIDAIVQSHEKFQRVSKDINWLNFTFHHQSELFMAAKGLEFALLHFTQRFDEISNAVQYITSGK
jgi:hypothetical protein